VGVLSPVRERERASEKREIRLHATLSLSLWLVNRVRTPSSPVREIESEERERDKEGERERERKGERGGEREGERERGKEGERVRGRERKKGRVRKRERERELFFIFKRNGGCLGTF
jgi:hypothetical protein